MDIHSDFEVFSNEPIVDDVYATRVFKLNNDGSLESAVKGQIFINGINKAVCTPLERKRRHYADDVPNDKCSCGFYVYDNKNIWWGANDFDDLIVKAVVRISGKVLLCNRGLRAEKLEIVALTIPDYVDEKIIAKLTNNYRNVRTFSNHVNMLNAYEVKQFERETREYNFVQTSLKKSFTFVQTSLKKSFTDLFKMLIKDFRLFLLAFLAITMFFIADKEILQNIAAYIPLLVIPVMLWHYPKTLITPQEASGKSITTIFSYVLLKMIAMFTLNVTMVIHSISIATMAEPSLWVDNIIVGMVCLMAGFLSALSIAELLQLLLVLVIKKRKNDVLK